MNAGDVEETRIVCQRCGQPVESLTGHLPACPPAPSGDVGAEVAAGEDRMFVAGEIRDYLGDVTSLSYGTRNRIAWGLTERLAERVEADVYPECHNADPDACSRCITDAQGDVGAEVAAVLAPLVADMTACGHCDGSCGSCQEDAARLADALAPLITVRVEAATLSVLDAIKTVREQAAEERVAMDARGEPLTDYSSGVLDGIDNAMLAAKKAVHRPEDRREVTSLEEWWACEDAYQAGIDHALTVRVEAAKAEAPARHEVAHEHGMELVCSCGTLISSYGLTRTLHSLWADHIRAARSRP